MLIPSYAIGREQSGDILYNFHWVVPGEAARAMQAWAGGLKPFLQAARHPRHHQSARPQ